MFGRVADVKQVSVRRFIRMTAEELKAGPVEVVKRKKLVGRFVPYEAQSRRKPVKHDFTTELTRLCGKLK